MLTTDIRAWVAATALCLPAGEANAQGHAHSHGVASLNLAVDSKGLSVQLEIPLDSLVGFERAPRNAREAQAVREAAARLRAADALFGIDPAARCGPARVRLDSKALPAALLDPDSPAAAAGVSAAKASDAHADLDATYAFACEQAGMLRKLDLDGLFKAFPRIRNIEAQVAGPKGQSKRRATRTRPEVSW